MQKFLLFLIFYIFLIILNKLNCFNFFYLLLNASKIKFIFYNLINQFIIIITENIIICLV
jgi:hypothetical protein